jgi:hypothetical protein
MRMGKIAAISLLCLALAAAACDGGGGAEPTATPTAMPAGETFEVGPDDTGKELTLDIGDRLVANMTCEEKCIWQFTDYGNRSVLPRIDFHFLLLPKDPEYSYAYVHTFEARKAGTSDIRMKYNCSPEDVPIIVATFNLSVTVR